MMHITIIQCLNDHKFRLFFLSPGQKDRVVYSRSPTPTSPGKTPSPSFGALGSKIPVRRHTPVDGYNDEDDDDSSPLQRNRVSFKETEDVRQFAVSFFAGTLPSVKDLF